jgi:SAM-dependent methyltransferase
MLEVARAKFRPGETVEFQPADATELPFPNRSFDALVCQFGIMFFPDKEKSYREAHRVLSPGGHYLFSVWDAHRFNPAQRRTHELLAELFANDPPRFYEVPFAYHRIIPSDAMTEEATDPRGGAHRQGGRRPGGVARGLVFEIRSSSRSACAAAMSGRVTEESPRSCVASSARRRLPIQIIFFEGKRP